MEGCPLFSYVCGENARVFEGRSEASWEQTYSGGIVFTDKPIRRSGTVRLVLNGSSHVDIGVTQTDPHSLRDPGQVRQLYLSDKCSIMNNIRVHKAGCDVSVQNLGDKVVSPPADQTYRVSVDPKKDVWLLVCIKFGNASVTIDSPAKFHEVTGENIDFEGIGKQKVKLKVQNPSAICVIDREITANYRDAIRIQINPIPGHNGTPPNIYHVRLGITHIRPDDISEFDPQSLSISRRSVRRSESRWMPIQTFERRKERTPDASNTIDSCQGELTITVDSEKELKFSHTSGVKGQWVVTTWPLFIVLELFRVSVKVLEPLRVGCSAYISKCKGRDAHPSMISTSRSSLMSKADSGYINPITASTSRDESTAGPTECSWHDWPSYASWVIESVSVLEADAKEQPDNFERKASAMITEMKDIKLKDDSYDELGQVKKDEVLYQRSNLARSDSFHAMSEIYRRLDNLEKVILHLKNVGKESQDKMYARFKSLKEVVDGITKPCPSTDKVMMQSTIRLNYTELLTKLETEGLIFILYQKGVIELHEKTNLVAMRHNRCSREDISDQLLNILGSRHVSRSAILEALEYTNQGDLKDKIIPK
ncbi:uncharacterized protein LOC132565112 [Ylistrum balloti]|uniref:uncharacterized protein LOC132565112 n=1 Tax=Ylistrum balloti TaxID=509963 RepID=UPI002905F729|nr:uncharacterized protein LOC132565112 [Ylistrum balloti]